MTATTPVGDIPAIVSGLRETFLKNHPRPLAWRMAQLQAFLRMVDENMERFAEALGKDLRRPHFESVAVEMADLKQQANFLIERIGKWMEDEQVPMNVVLYPGSHRLHREALGVCLVISPWNFPFSLCLNPALAALATGNTVVLKPSEVNNACTELMSELIPKYLDTDAVKIVLGGKEETTALLKEKFNHITYTGGGKVAEIVMAAAAKHLTPVLLELGGKNPIYVDESANIPVTARRLVSARNVNAGQFCMAPDLILVHEKVQDELLKEFEEALHSFYGEGQEQQKKSGSLSRIINAHHFERVKGFLDEAHGGKVICGGELDKDDLYIAPTIVLNPSPTSLLMTEEVFGPVLTVKTVKDVNEAVACTQGRDTPLASYVFAEDEAVMEQWVGRVEAGGMCINDCLMQTANTACPFGGKGASGMGAYRGEASLETYTHTKSVFWNTTKVDPSIRYPPYTPKAEKIISKSFDLPRWVRRLPSVLPSVAGVVAVAGAVAVALMLYVDVSFSVSWKA